MKINFHSGASGLIIALAMALVALLPLAWTVAISILLILAMPPVLLWQGTLEEEQAQADLA